MQYFSIINQLLHIMKIQLIRTLMVFVMLFIAAACGDDDDGASVAPDLDNTEFTFDASEPPIEIPSALSSSTNQEALTINSYLQLANGMSGWLGLLEAPQGATKSNIPVGRKGSKNGRTQEDVVVYTWINDVGSGTTFTVSYQISESATAYIFETFWKINDGDFVRVLYAEESKDELRNGFMEVYAFTPFDTDSGVLTESYFFRYEWNENAAGQFNFSIVDSESDFRIEVVVNPDGSGLLTYELGGTRLYEATWNAAGTSGTYTTYDFDGEVVDSGSWEA